MLFENNWDPSISCGEILFPKPLWPLPETAEVDHSCLLEANSTPPSPNTPMKGDFSEVKDSL